MMKEVLVLLYALISARLLMDEVLNPNVAELVTNLEKFEEI